MENASQIQDPKEERDFFIRPSETPDSGKWFNVDNKGRRILRTNRIMTGFEPYFYGAIIK